MDAKRCGWSVVIYLFRNDSYEIGGFLRDSSIEKRVCGIIPDGVTIKCVHRYHRDMTVNSFI